MLAYIVEGAHLFVAPSDREKLLTCDLKREVVAHFGDVIGMTCELPCVAEQPVHFLGENSGVRIVPGIKGKGDGCVHSWLLLIDAKLMAAEVEFLDTVDNLVAGDRDNKAQQCFQKRDG